ncbi:MAG: hypothetical protein M0Z85_01905 [Gammaproteobacteria bacterium]|nr:hypothetical protein [Gammaproteobacteria bacterium]
MSSQSDQDTENAVASATNRLLESVAPSLPQEDGAQAADPRHGPEVLNSNTVADADNDSEPRNNWQDRVDDFLAIGDTRFWADLDGLTVEQAAALSVGIDPGHLEKLQELQINDQMGEEEPTFDFGNKQDLYLRNLTLITTAIKVRKLRIANGLISREDFEIWAKTKGLSLPSQNAVHANAPVDIFLRDFLGADYQDYARLKSAILAARECATGRLRKQPEVYQYLAEETGISPNRSKAAKKHIAYVAQPNSWSRPGRRGPRQT